MAQTNGTNGTNGVKSGRPPVDLAAVKEIGMAAYRAPSLLQPHRAREALADAHAGKISPLMAFFMGISSPPLTKVVAQLGYDIVGIDWEHNATNVETMTQMVHDIQFISEGRSMAMVRVKDHAHSTIGYALDAGAGIIMVPQVDTVEQAKEIVSAAKFGADINGARSAPPCRWLPGVADKKLDSSKTFWQNLNDQAALIIQIECVEGINNLDAILTECGDQIDSVWLGSLDLRISMGLSEAFGPEPEFLEQVARFEEIVTKHNMPCSGFAVGPPEVKAKLARGKSMLTIAADVFALLGTMGDLAEAKASFPAMDYQGVYKK